MDGKPSKPQTIRESKNRYTKAILWNPSFMESLYNYYQVLAMTDRKDEGIPYLKRAYDLSPDSPEIGLALGYTYYEEENYAKAKVILEHVLSVDPENRTASRLLDLVTQEQAKKAASRQ
jgi:tetratricopeptide (TPR) repeat protein